MEREKIRAKRIFETTIADQGVIDKLRYNRSVLLPYFVTAKPPHFNYPCSVRIEFHVYGLKNKGKFDIDHLIEQTLNALTDEKLISDDKVVFNVEATMYDTKQPFLEKVIIEIYEWKT